MFQCLAHVVVLIERFHPCIQFSPLFYMGSIDLHRTSSFLRQLLLVEIALQFDYTRINFLTYKGIGFYFTLNIRSRCRRLSLSHSYSTRAERMQRSFMLL